MTALMCVGFKTTCFKRKLQTRKDIEVHKLLPTETSANQLSITSHWMGSPPVQRHDVMVEVETNIEQTTSAQQSINI